ncbi:hypothetical protein U91I_02432 [alpha proteobacterium U9-1i]|nr:hypothetical protein U91I_02432 [alpha proteobacterium U9-1i]
MAKLSTVKIKAKAARKVAGGSKGPAKRKPKFTPAEIEQATSEAIEKVRSSFYDDEAFRAAITEITSEARVDKNGAALVFATFFPPNLLAEGTAKRSVLKQLKDERQTKVLRERRIGSAPEPQS